MAKTWIDYYRMLSAARQTGQSNAYAPDFSLNSDWYNVDPNSTAATVGEGGGGRSFGDRVWNDDLSVGKRILDVLSRGNYASANFSKSYVEQGGNKDDFHKFDFLKALGEGWQGLKGEDKTTYGDVDKILGKVYGANGEEVPYDEAGGFDKFFSSFSKDVFLDPTTYMGIGTLKHLIKGGQAAVGGVKGTKVAESVVKSATAKAAGELATKGIAEIPTKNVDEFLKHLNKNANDIPDLSPQMLPEDFITKSRSTPTGPKGFLKQTDDTERLAGPAPSPNDLPRTFNVDSAGDVTRQIAPENRMLPGPPTEVVTGRAFMDEVGRSIKDNPISQFKYGNEFNDIPETGFFKKAGEEAPAPKAPEIDPFDPEVMAKIGKPVELPPDQMDDIIERAVLASNDEIRLSTKLGPQMVNVQQAKAGIKALHAAGKTAHANVLEEKLRMFVKQVQTHAKAAVGPDPQQPYKTLDDYLKDNGYESVAKTVAPVKQVEAAIKDVGTAEYIKMSPAEKIMFFQQFPFLDKKHVTYLAQASNLKSFKTRWNKILNTPREELTRDVDDLLDAIDSGRINSVQEPNIDKLLALTGTKTLKQLAAYLKKSKNSLSKAEQKMLGKITGTAEAATKTPVTDVGQGVDRGFDVGPDYTGPIGNQTLSGFNKSTNPAVIKAQARVAKVKPAQKMIEEASTGVGPALEKTASTLPVDRAPLYDAALRYAINRNVIEPSSPLYKFMTKRGVKRTHKTPHKGLGARIGVWGKFDEYSVVKGLMANSKAIDAEITKIIKSAGGKPGSYDAGAVRSRAMYDLLMPVMRAFNDTLQRGGIFPVAGTTNKSLPFGIYDVLDVLPREFVEKHFFTMGSKSGKGIPAEQIPPTVLLDVFHDLAAASMRGKLSDEIVVAVVDKLKNVEFKSLNGTKYPNYFGQAVAKSPALLQQTTNDMLEALPDLVQRINQNAARRTALHAGNVEKVTEEALNILAKSVLDKSLSSGDLAKIALDTDEVVVKTAQRVSVYDPADIANAKFEVARASEELGFTPELKAEGRAAKEMAKASTKAEKAAVNRKIAEMHGKAADELGDIPVEDVGRRFEAGIMYGVLKRWFPHFKNEDIRPLFLNRNSATQTVARHYAALLANIHAKHSKDTVLTAWKELQNGTRSADSTIAAAQEDLEEALKAIFSADPEYNVFARNGINVYDLESHYSHFGIHDKFKVRNGQSLNNVWKTWETDNPLDLLSRVQAATMATLGKKMLGADLSRHFGSPVFRPGYVKVTSSKGILGKYLDTSVFYPREIVKQMRVLDEFMVSMNQAPSRSKLLSVYDNVLHSYKAGLTIYRPGHHVRNMVGDVWLNHMAGMNDVSYYGKAMHVMAQNHGRYRDFDAVAAFMQGKNPKMAGRIHDTKSPMILYRGNGISGTEVYQAAFSRGILPDYRTLEDVQMGQELAFQKFRPFGGKLQKAAASTSEARDHYIRLAQFMYEIEHGKYRTLEEAYDLAAAKVRKWHPDGTDLTRFEGQVMRRSFLFYSWIRKAIPLVLESMVMSPGKFNIYPKAMYSIAEANGIDLESYQNPFPDDQLFPDWIRDSMTGPVAGEAGNYAGINPGVPGMDVMKDFMGDQVGGSILGSLTPAAKIPIELMQPGQNRDLRAGIPINDYSDYFDRQIPGVNTLSSITGRSVTGLGQPVGGEPQPGDTPRDPQSFLKFMNFLSGLGMVDMSKPNYINQAKIEERNKRSEERRNR